LARPATRRAAITRWARLANTRARWGAFDKCQVSVHLTYATADGARALLDCRLYLPQQWADDPVRREQAGVPA